MNARPPQPRLADLGPLWARMIDGLADMQADLLRRMHGQMADALEQDDAVKADQSTEVSDDA